MQTAPKGTYSGMLGCATGILKNEGPLAFYKASEGPFGRGPCAETFLKGTLSPLMGIGLCVSIQFGALESVKRYMQQRNVAAGRGGVDGKTLSGGQLLTAGAIAGLSNSIVSGPVEHIRIRSWVLS